MAILRGCLGAHTADNTMSDTGSNGPTMPKTRSGTIMRRLLRDVAEAT